MHVKNKRENVSLSNMSVGLLGKIRLSDIHDCSADELLCVLRWAQVTQHAIPQVVFVTLALHLSELLTKKNQIASRES